MSVSANTSWNWNHYANFLYLSKINFFSVIAGKVDFTSLCGCHETKVKVKYFLETRLKLKYFQSACLDCNENEQRVVSIASIGKEYFLNSYS